MSGWRKRQVLDMAREAGGCDITSHGWTSWVGTQSTEFLDRFAELVRADEREACAKVCEDSNTWDLHDPNGFAANLIRARGQA